MRERLEDLEDALEMRTIEAKVGEREYLSAEFVDRMLGGEHPLRI